MSELTHEEKIRRVHRSERRLTIAAAYGAASLAAGTAMGAAAWFLLVVPASLSQVGPSQVDPKAAEGIAFFMFVALPVCGATLATPVICVLAFLPAAAMIWFAERRSVRSPAFYAVAGALTAAVVIATIVGVSAWSNAGSASARQTPGTANTWLTLASLAALFGLPGLCGGLTYWRVAGRDAGRGPEPSSAAASGSTTQLPPPSPQSLQS